MAIGADAGQTNQGANGVAIGNSAGSGQGVNTIAIGNTAGSSQSTGSIALGVSAGQSQGQYSIAAGYQSGQLIQAQYGTALGYQAGQSSQGSFAIALGYQAGQTSQSTGAIAIGTSAGGTTQGINAIAIGANAGVSNQASNSICINASNSTLNTSTSGFYVNPVRVLSATGATLVLNQTTNEIFATTAPTSSGTGTASNLFSGLNGQGPITPTSGTVYVNLLMTEVVGGNGSYTGAAYVLAPTNFNQSFTNIGPSTIHIFASYSISCSASSTSALGGGFVITIISDGTNSYGSAIMAPVGTTVPSVFTLSGSSNISVPSGGSINIQMSNTMLSGPSITINNPYLSLVRWS